MPYFGVNRYRVRIDGTMDGTLPRYVLIDTHDDDREIFATGNRERAWTMKSEHERDYTKRLEAAEERKAA